MFCSPPHLSSPPFQVLSRPNAPCQPDFIPPFSCPVFPARHAHLRVSCMFSDSQTIISFSFFFLPRTRQYQNSAELLWRMGVFFFRSGSVSVCEVTYSDKAPGGGVCCHRPVTMGQTHGGGGSAEGPASQKALPLLIKRPSFLA